MRPGVNVNIIDVPPTRTTPTDTGTVFVLGTSDKGPTSPVLIGSMQDFVTMFGARQTYSLLYDWLDTFFHEGGRRAYVQRVVGPAATTGFKALFDTTGSVDPGDVSLRANALGPGSYSTTIGVGVLAGVVSGFRIQVQLSGQDVEVSGDLADPAAAVEWSQNSNYIRLVLGASAENPRVQAVAAMSAGADDRASITITEKTAAIAKFTKDLGPGQIVYPGDTVAATQAALIAHADITHRCPLIDLADTATDATLITAVGSARTRWGATFTPWAVVPGYVAGTSRVVPYSAIEAGIIARNDVRLSPNAAAAGEDGQSIYAIRLSQAERSDASRKALNDAGINVARIIQGGVRTYGYRSTVNPPSDPTWVGFGGARLLMQIAYRGEAILESFMFDEIDGFDRLFSRVRGQLTTLLNEYYTAGSLYGQTPGEAFVVVCDTTNNTPLTIADRQLIADVGVRVSEMAEMVTLNLTRVPVSGTIV
jgi:phage tail sheath protein FI